MVTYKIRSQNNLKFAAIFHRFINNFITALKKTNPQNISVIKTNLSDITLVMEI